MHVHRDAGTTENRELIDAALARLNGPQRQVIVLRYLEDLSLEQTAECLAIKPEAVAKRAQRGLEKMRAVLSSREGAATVGLVAALLQRQHVLLTEAQIGAMTQAAHGAATAGASSLALATGATLMYAQIKVAAVMVIAVAVVGTTLTLGSVSLSQANGQRSAEASPTSQPTAATRLGRGSGVGDALPAVPPLQPGDLVGVNIYELLSAGKDFAETRQIMPDGTVRVPFLGRVKFAGLTPRQARDLLERMLVRGRFTADPQVRVALELPAAKAPEKPVPIRPGDRLVVRIFELRKPGEDCVGLLQVNSSGEINVPSVGAVKVDGLRTDQIEEELIGRLGKVLMHPGNLIRVDRGEVAVFPAFGHRLESAWPSAPTTRKAR